MRNIFVISLLLLLISCSKDDTEDRSVNTLDFIGTWICPRENSSYQIKVGPGPTVTSFAVVPAPGYTTDAKYSITSSTLEGDKLIFIALDKTQVGDIIRECTCSLENKNTLKVLQVLKVNNVIKGSAELIYKRKT